MKIVELTAENVKRLKAVQIRPDGPVQVVAGRNAQGKSSVLDSIWLALGGGKASRATDKPIRDGEDKAMVRLDLGDLVVTRKWSGDNTTLLVESADGASYKKPQEVLDALVGKLSFDPLAFANDDPKGQVNTLLGLVELPFDPAALAAKRAALYDRRHGIGQQVARAKGLLESLDVPDPNLPKEPVPMTALAAEYAAVVQEQSDRAQAQMAYGTAERELREAEAALAAAQQRLNQATGALKARAKDLTKHRDPSEIQTDVAHLKGQMDQVEATNQAIRDAQGYYHARDEYDSTKAEWDGLTVQIEAVDAEKAKGLAEAVFPIKGLWFDDDGVVYNGIPFSQASSAEQLKVSMAIAMAMNPKLRVIRITDGSLLDAENMATIEAMAKDADFQVWIERVDESGKAGVVIEDGMVAK